MYMIQILVIMHYNSYTALFSPHRPTGYMDRPNFYWQRNTQLSRTASPNELWSTYEEDPCYIFLEIA